jgi:glycosyltransferase involved in cell wall biosynthesis
MQFEPIEKRAPLSALPDEQVARLFSNAGASTSGGDCHIALVGTFAPRKCGIATFTSDVFAQLGNFHAEIGVDVYALDHAGSQLVYEQAKQVIRSDDAQSYSSAARRINQSGVDAVWIQHEFGIFGADDGEAVCDFVAQIAAPLIFTFHTVLTSPSARQLRIMRHLITRASRIMVMSEHGRSLLIETYGAPAEIIDIIHHGAPDRPFGRNALFKDRLGLSGRNVLMTFGLLGPGKGLERVIEALPAIVARHPETVYRIVGATHPNLVAEQGEAYRERLQALAASLGVEQHVTWEDRFLDTSELLDQLEACDIYVTPYMNLQQSTSGTLSYAVALGKAVVSTPYVHARELLAEGIGVLVEPDSHAALAAAIIDLLDHPPKLSAAQRRAYARGRSTVWREFARASAILVRGAVGEREIEVPHAVAPGLSAVLDMSDSTGMLQHAVGIVPDREHGYCLDDNARALMLMNVASGLSPPERKSSSLVYASFMQHAWNEEAGRFRNFMRFDRSWCEAIGSDDSNGRALWALGQTVEFADDADLRWWALHWFDRAAIPLSQLSSPRAVAFTILGAGSVLRGMGCHAGAEAILANGGDVLHRLLVSSRRPDWAWFEAVLGYDNPRLPQALIEAGDLLNRPEWKNAGLETLEWIAARQTARDGMFRPIGSETFGRAAAQLPFDQQPLEAQAAIEAAEAAYRATRDAGWLDEARTAYAWFFGANDRRVRLVDLGSGCCRDGLTPRGRNENCGAESILAFQLAHYSLQRMHQVAETQCASAVPLRRTAPLETKLIVE